MAPVVVSVVAPVSHVTAASYKMSGLVVLSACLTFHLISCCSSFLPSRCKRTDRFVQIKFRSSSRSVFVYNKSM